VRRPAPRRGPVYADQDQVAALNSYVTTVLGSAAQPNDLLQLSRLLADPRDQVLWLSEWVGRLDERPGHRKQALVLAEKTSDRVDLWRDRGVEQLDPQLERLERIKANIPSPPWEITDPHELAASLDQIEPTELLPTHRFQLLARGVPVSRLKLDSTDPPDDWDVPRVVVAALAEHGDGNLPAIWKLLDLDRELRAARQRFNAGLPDAPPRTADAFRIAEALLGRALGVDTVDRRPSGEDPPDNWGTLAAQLEEDNLWQWAALARLLQAAATAEVQGRQQIAGEARERCAQTFRVVDPQALLALHTGDAAWLARLEGSELEADEKLPLTDDFRQRARAARADLEKQFREQEFIRQGKPPTAQEKESAFRLMQLAKAAELDWDVTGAQLGPIKIAQLQKMLGSQKPLSRRSGPDDEYFPKIHLFLELLETGEDECYGLAVHSTLATLGQTDSFAVELIKRNTPERVVQDALDRVGRRNTVWTQGKILIAPDHRARTAEWLETGEWTSGLFEHIDPERTTGSWVVYVPTAGALFQGSGWTLERALRLWYQSGLQADRPGIDFVRSRPDRSSAIKSFWFREDKIQARLYAISLGPDEYPSALQEKSHLTRNLYRKELMSKKKSGTHTNVLALIVAE